MQHRGVSREKVVVFYTHSRHQGVQRLYTCADITTIVIPGNHIDAAANTTNKTV